MSNWHYAKGGEKHGPIKAAQLKQLVRSGQLSPNDLVWREDMKEWRKASTVKGLFPETPVPPSTARTAGPPQLPSPKTVSVSVSPNGGAVAPSDSPVLWNPTGAGAWSLLFTPAFGSSLLMKNWKAMGNEPRAKRSLMWLCGFLGFIFFAFVTPDTRAFTTLFRFGGSVLFVIWATKEVKQQSQYVKDTYGNEYVRRPWGKPLAIGAACMVVPFIGLITTLSDSAGVSVVKSGRLDAFPDVTVGQLIENFLESPSWDAGETNDGKNFVNVEGRMLYYDKPVRGTLQFLIHGEQFELRAFEINGVPQNNLVKSALFEKMYDQYKSKRK